MAHASSAAVKKKPWTVLVFMHSELEQESFAIRHLREMKRVRSSSHLHVVVQHRDFLGTWARAVIRNATAEHHPVPPAFGRRQGPRRFHDFLRWAVDTCPAERYVLVLWGHSYGIRFGHEDRDALTVADIASTLRALKRQRRGRRLDMIAFKSCTMSFAEAICELSGTADFMVAPQGAMPHRGFPFQPFLTMLQRDPGTTANRLGEKLVADFVRSYRRRHVALTMIDLGAAQRLRSMVRQLTKALQRAARHDEQRRAMWPAFQNAAPCKHVRPLIDLTDLCQQLRARVPDLAVRRTAANVMRLIRAGRAGVVCAHQSKGRSLARLNGVGIYASKVTDRDDWEQLRMRSDGYRGLQLNRATGWDRFVNRLGNRRSQRGTMIWRGR